jgi:LysM repeat protein
VNSGVIIGSATPAPVSTPNPTVAPIPSPTITPIAQGTVVAEGDVASPKGSIHFHYRMIADGDNTYSAEYSRFTSTVPVPVSVTLIDIPPRVGDGLTYHGVGDHLLGGPTTTSAPTSTASIDLGQPSYLTTLVTYSSVASAGGVPVELGPGKVLAVNTVRWSVPVRQSNVHPIDGGARTYANGTVTAKTPSGAPKRYVVAQGDTTAIVAQRFGISVEDLVWLNPNLPGSGDNRYLYVSTTLNLDPDSL